MRILQLAPSYRSTRTSWRWPTTTRVPPTTCSPVTTFMTTSTRAMRSRVSGKRSGTRPRPRTITTWIAGTCAPICRSSCWKWTRTWSCIIWTTNWRVASTTTPTPASGVRKVTPLHFACWWAYGPTSFTRTLRSAGTSWRGSRWGRWRSRTRTGWMRPSSDCSWFFDLKIRKNLFYDSHLG